MPTISEDSDLFVEIVVFTVEPEKQQGLIETIVGEVDRWVRYLPGFVSATYHKSLDGTRVVNYAQWTTQEAWQGFTQNPETAVLREKIGRIGMKVAPESHSYKVQRVIEAPKT